MKEDRKRGARIRQRSPHVRSPPRKRKSVSGVGPEASGRNGRDPGMEMSDEDDVSEVVVVGRPQEKWKPPTRQKK